MNKISLQPVLVTGASGYIGSHLVLGLLEQNRPVHITVRSSSSLASLEHVKDRLTIHLCDNPEDDLQELFQKNRIETVFHLAAFTNHRDLKALDTMIASNYVFGAHLLRAMCENGVKKFINTGSFAEHADGTAAIKPQSIYSATKAALYPAIEYYALSQGLAAITLKLYDVYGANDPRPKLLSALQAAVRENKPVDVSLGIQNISYVHINDVTAAFLKAEENLEPRTHRTFFVPGPEMMPLRNYIELFLSMAGKPGLANFGGRPFDQNNILHPYQGETMKNWTPTIRAEDGFKDLL